MTNITIKYKTLFFMHNKIYGWLGGCVYMCEGGCVSTLEQKIIENDGECSVWLLGNGEPFSVCQFFPKLSQFG